MVETTHEPPASPACERVRSRLEQLVDGGLQALEEARDLGHLEACEGCAAVRAELRAWLQAVPGELAASPAQLTAVRSGLEERLVQRSPARGVVLRRLAGSRFGQAVLAAAAGLALLFALDGGRVLQGVATDALDEASSALEYWHREMPVPTWRLDEQ